MTCSFASSGMKFQNLMWWEYNGEFHLLQAHKVLGSCIMHVLIYPLSHNSLRFQIPQVGSVVRDFEEFLL